MTNQAAKITRIITVPADYTGYDFRWYCDCHMSLAVTFDPDPPELPMFRDYISVYRYDIPCITSCPDCGQEYRIEWGNVAYIEPSRPYPDTTKPKVPQPPKGKFRTFPAKKKYRAAVHKGGG
jgi:hypothetical protein